MSKKKVILLSPSEGAFSETFIRAHRERLPFEIISLYRWRVPYLTDDGKWIGIVPSCILRVARSLRLNMLQRYAEDWSDTVVSEWLAKNRPLAILAEYGPLGAGIAASAKKANIPLIVIFHGFDAYQNETIKLYKNKYELMFGSVAAIIAVSEPMKSQLITLGAPADKIFVNSCGVDPEIFYGGNPESSKCKFLFVGRFVSKKGPLQTIESFARVIKKLTDAELEMIGDGPLLAMCRKRCIELGIDKAVIFSGSKSSEYVVNSMRNARALVQHSVRCRESGDQEGTPVSIIEAQMTGLPVIATRHAGIPWVVQHGLTGLLVEEEDVEGMAMAMHTVGCDVKVAKEMGAAARSRATEFNTLDQHIAKLSDSIYKVVE
jgi:colanic acid/amylovoran biosynthesis glycosyltransferase